MGERVKTESVNIEKCKTLMPMTTECREDHELAPKAAHKLATH